MLITSACSNDAGSPAEQGPAATKPKSPAPLEDEPTTPPTAVESVRIALSAVREGEPDRLWQRLPKTYRDDLADVVHRFAAKLDADRWKRTFALLNRTTGVMQSHGPKLLDDPALDRTPVASLRLSIPDETLRENWATVVETLKTVGESELADPDQLAGLDVEAFLTGTGRRLLSRAKPLVAPLDDVTVESVAVDGNRATLRITGLGLEARDHEYVRVGDRWVPATIHAAWDTNLDTARRAVDGLTVDAVAWDAQLDAWEATLQRLESGSTPAENDRVTVVVPARLDAGEEERLQVLLNSAAADPDLAVSIPQQKGEETHFEVSDAGPLEAFAERLGRADRVEVVEIDGDSGTITIRLDPMTEPRG